MYRYTDEQLASMKKVEASRDSRYENLFPRMTAEEKDAVLKENHPDYIESAYECLKVGKNKGDKVLHELADLLQGKSRILDKKIDLSNPDYDVDVLVIGGGGAGSSAAITAHSEGANVMIVTKLRIGDANTMMAEGGIQAADKENDSPAIHYLDAFGGGHFAAKPELLKMLVYEAPSAIEWLSELGVMFDKDENGNMITTHGGGTSRKRMHACKDYSGAEIMRTLRDEVLNRNIPVVDFTAAIEIVKDEDGKAAGAVFGALVTEKVRSLGAQLVNKNGEAFVYSLETRDVTAASIIRECKKRNNGIKTTDGEGVWLDTPMIEKIGGEGTILKRIPAMFRMFDKYGIDIRKEPILVYPTLHYQNGGIDIDGNCETAVEDLFVAGEAVGGIHGRNRLMGNSLLDVIVFGRDAGRAAARKSRSVNVGKLTLSHVADFEKELDAAGLKPEKLSPQLLPDYRRKDM